MLSRHSSPFFHLLRFKAVGVAILALWYSNSLLFGLSHYSHAHSLSKLFMDFGRCERSHKSAGARSAKAIVSLQPTSQHHVGFPKGNASCNKTHAKAPRTAFMCKAARKIPRIVEALAKNSVTTCNPRSTHTPVKVAAMVRATKEVPVPRAAPSKKPKPSCCTNDSLRFCDKDGASGEDARFSASPFSTEVVRASHSDSESDSKEFVSPMDLGAGKFARWSAVHATKEVPVPRAAPSEKPKPSCSTNDSMRSCDKDDASGEDARFCASPLATEVVLVSDSDSESDSEEFVNLTHCGAGKFARWCKRQDIFFECNILGNGFGGRVLFKPYAVVNFDRDETLMEGSFVAVKCKSVQYILQQRHGSKMENILVRVCDMKDEDECQDLWHDRCVYHVPVLRKRQFDQNVGSACIYWTNDVRF